MCQLLLLAQRQRMFYGAEMNLGKRVLNAREKRGLTQAQLAELAGTSQAAISALENRDSKTSEQVFELADALRVNPRWLQTGAGDSGLDAEAWLPTAAQSSEEAALLADYRAASDGWKLTVRLLARTPQEEQPQVSRDVNILMTTIFGKAVPDARLGDKWTRPDIQKKATAPK